MAGMAHDAAAGCAKTEHLSNVRKYFYIVYFSLLAGPGLSWWRTRVWRWELLHISSLSRRRSFLRVPIQDTTFYLVLGSVLSEYVLRVLFVHIAFRVPICAVFQSFSGWNVATIFGKLDNVTFYRVEKETKTNLDQISRIANMHLLSTLKRVFESFRLDCVSLHA